MNHPANPHDTAQFAARGAEGLPGLLGFTVLSQADKQLTAQMAIKPEFMAPNGYLHAGTVVAFADTAAGYATQLHLPPQARGFTTVELKTNFLSTANSGKLVARAQAMHLGRTTQVWDVVVSHEETGKTLALFRCTQTLLY
ncbi:PaaI family thioesterase [Parvibium lacunae]|uniref:PaaI family thioesterase n=1 Tax=Parvibium lacunae TaxID=1888893 RepID=A0A368L3G0_9BURK|nr:PaaI family thioesterase [Parvibium lacunae]RCS58065.1 PaaI family thioesterase [Parvibium lacunae]